MSTTVETVTRPSTPPSKRKRGGLNAGQGRRGLFLVLPTIVVLTVVIVYPLISAVILSFQKDSGLDKATGLFVEGGPAGLSNYTHWLLADCGTGRSSCPPGSIGSLFWPALTITLFFTVVSVSLEVVLGLWFATIMNREFRGRGLVRAAILVPWAIPTAVTAKLFYFMFAYDGIINKLIGFVGISPQLWTSDPWAAKFAIIIADVWKTTPFMALRTLDVLRIYDLPAILTQGAGGTTSLSMLVIKQKNEGFHSASALSTIVFLLIAFTAFLFIKFGGADVIQRPPSSKKAKAKDDTPTRKDKDAQTGNPGLDHRAAHQRPERGAGDPLPEQPQRQDPDVPRPGRPGDLGPRAVLLD